MMPISYLLLLIATLHLGAPSPDPECYMTLPEIAKYYGYPAEVHVVRTADDYLLELQRIPTGRNESGWRKATRAVVFMQHGLLADGNNFLSNLANQSAATVFADAGFDVWVSNSRGTPPSQKHIGFGPEDDRFWNFTWQEMSKFDLTASVDYVLKETGQDSLYYIGHSQGTVIMFARLAEDPDFAKKETQLVTHRTTIVIDSSVPCYGSGGYSIPYWGTFQTISLPIAQNVCTLDIGFVDGREKQFNMSRVGTYMCHMPAATSTKDLLHWVQVVRSRRFQMFDFGPEGNKVEYGQPTPPVYNLSRITAPTFLYWSKDDILADTDDIRETILKAMNHTVKESHELPHYTHLDFVYGLDAAHDVYSPIIKSIRTDHEEKLWRAAVRENRVH